MGQRFKQLVSHKVFRNFSFLMFSNIVMQLLNVISIILVTKIFSPEIFGEFSFMIAQSLLLSTIADLGIRNIAVRAIARNDLEQNRIFSLSLISILISNSILLILFLSYNQITKTLSIPQVLLVSISSLIACLSVVCEFSFLGRQKMATIAISNVLYSTAWLLVTYSLHLSKISFSLNTLFIFYILTSLIKPILLLRELIKSYSLKISLKGFWKSYTVLLKQSFPFFALVLVALPANYLTNNFLEINSTMTEVGLFSLAKKFTLPISMILGVMLNALFPNLSVLWSQNPERFKHLVNRGIPLFILIAGFLAFFLGVVIKPVITFFFSAEYHDVVFISRVQVWYSILMAISSLIGTIWASMDNEKLALKAAIINTIINTPILWFGSKYGSYGLSIAYVASTTLFMVILWLMFLKTNRLRSNYSWVWLLIVILGYISISY